MLLRDEGQDVTHEYVAVARQIRVYEKEKLAQWRNHVDKIVAHSLKKSILEFDPPNAKTDKAERRAEGGGNDRQSMVTSLNGLSDSAKDKRDQERKIVVNFDRNLQETIREAKYLDRLGIQVPDMAMSVTLQDDRYYKFCESLNAMLHDYHGVRAEVREHERVLLEDHLSQLYQAIKPGFSPLNWNSLSIDEFVHDCTKAINTFKATLKQVQSKAEQMENDVNKIARAALVKPMPDNYDSSMDIAEFYDYQDTHREKVVDDLVGRYKGITELLGKVEEQVIQGVVSYMAPQMRDYYRYVVIFSFPPQPFASD
jgi:dynein heavy chain